MTRSNNADISPDAVAQIIDATLLRTDARNADVAELISTAHALHCGAICVSPSMLPVQLPAGSDLAVATVAGFPSGKHDSII